MIKIKRQFLNAIWIIVLFVAMLTGCGKSDETTTEEVYEGTLSDDFVSEAEEKILILYIQTGGSTIPDPDITTNEISTGDSLLFTLLSRDAGYAWYAAEITEGEWEIIVECSGYDTYSTRIMAMKEDQLGLIDIILGEFSEEEEDEGTVKEEADESEDVILNIPEDALEYDGHSYKLYTFEDSMTWQEAQDACELLGGHLVSITSENEQSFLVDNIFEEGSDFWIGGIYRDEEWIWGTGETLEFTAWSQEPTESSAASYPYMGVSDYSWQYYTEEGKWTDRTVGGYICEWDQEALAYVSSLSQISEDDLTTLKDTVEAAFYLHVEESWSEDNEFLRGVDYVGAYFLAPTEKDDGNRLYLIYKVNVEVFTELSEGYLDQIVTYYHAAYFDDLTIGLDGCVRTDDLVAMYSTNKYEIYDVEYAFYYYGYETLKEIEDMVASAAGDTYTIESAVSDVETQYTAVKLDELSAEAAEETSETEDAAGEE